MTLLLAFSRAARKTFDRLRCQWHSANQSRQTRAVMAGLTAHELRDIGLSHAEALPAMHARCK